MKLSRNIYSNLNYECTLSQLSINLALTSLLVLESLFLLSRLFSLTLVLALSLFASYKSFVNNECKTLISLKTRVYIGSTQMGSILKRLNGLKTLINEFTKFLFTYG